MWSVKPQMDVQSKKPAMKSSSNKELNGLVKDNNCQATMSHKKQKKCEYNDSKSQSFQCSDKNCQENINMQSVTNTNAMHLPKPVIRRLCKDKTCQSTRCYKKRVQWDQCIIMTNAVKCNLNLKELCYYHCHMQNSNENKCYVVRRTDCQ